MYAKIMEQLGESPTYTPPNDNIQIDIVLNNGENTAIINYFDLDGNTAQYWNGRANRDYYITIKGTLETHPRKAEKRLFYAPTMLQADVSSDVLHVWSSPIEVLKNCKKHPFSIALSELPIDNKKIQNQQLIDLLIKLKPESIIINFSPDLETVEYSEHLDLSNKREKIFNTIRAWQKFIWRRDMSGAKIGRLSKKYLPELYYCFGEETVQFTYSTEMNLKNDLVLEANAFYAKYETIIGDRNFWFMNKNYRVTFEEDTPQLEEIPLSEFFRLADVLINDFELIINEVTTEREVTLNQTRHVIDDEIKNTLLIMLKDKGFKYELKISKNLLADAIKSNWRALLQNSRYRVPVVNPFNDYFDSLPPYDGKDHISAHFGALKLEQFDINMSALSDTEKAQLCRAILDSAALANATVEQDGVTEENMTWRVLAPHFWRKWLVGAIRQLLFKNDVNEFMPIIVGAANKGKTTFIKQLLPPELQEYFLQKDIFEKDTDKLERLRSLAERFIILFDDNPDKWNTQTWKTVKEWVTTKKVTYRKLFESETRDYPKIASFIGTSNFRDLLADTGGDRRFLIFIINDIERNWWDNPDIDIDNVWAQALHLAKNKEFKTNLNNAEFKMITIVNENFRNISIEEQLLIDTYRPATPEEAQQWEADRDSSSMVCMQESGILNALRNKYNAAINMKNLRAALLSRKFRDPHCYKGRRIGNDNNSRYCYGLIEII